AAVWETVSRTNLIREVFISRPSAIVASVPDLFSDSFAREAMLITIRSIGLAIALAIIAGVIIGYVMGMNRILRDVFYAPTLFLMSVPSSIFIPIFLVVFGINPNASL